MLSKEGRHQLFIPIRDNNAGKELGAATISRWICTTIVDSHFFFGEELESLPIIQAHEVRAVTASF